MKLVIPKSLIAKENDLTGEENSWADIAKSLKLPINGISAHKLIRAKAPEIHNAICKDCIYDKLVKSETEKGKVTKGEAAKPVKKGKTAKKSKAEGTITCNCGAFVEAEFISTVYLAPVLTGGVPAGPQVYCLNCAVTKLMA